MDEILRRLDDTSVGLEDVKVVLSSWMKTKSSDKSASIDSYLDHDPNRKLSFKLSKEDDGHDHQ